MRKENHTDGERCWIVLKTAEYGMTSKEAYDEIIRRKLYTFPAKKPDAVVNSMIRRHCLGLDFPTASPVKYFKIVELKETDLKQKVSRLNSLRRAFEEELKVNSVSDVSGKMLLLLEELQDTLYTNLIQQVESDLNRKFAELIRKKDFFSYVKIDRNFSVHILRETEIDRENLLSLLRSGGVSAAADALGETAVAALKERCHADSAAELRKAVSVENEKIENSAGNRIVERCVGKQGGGTGFLVVIGVLFTTIALSNQFRRVGKVAFNGIPQDKNIRNNRSHLFEIFFARFTARFVRGILVQSSVEKAFKTNFLSAERLNWVGTVPSFVKDFWQQ